MHQRQLCSGFMQIALLMLIAACETSPSIHTDRDPNANLSSYRTFSFFDPLGTDRTYSTIVSSRLKEATRREMEAHGYRYVESGGDLAVNFNVKVKDKQQLRSEPAPGGFYGYRRGFYGAWTGYPYDVYTVDYQEGTLAIDLIDPARKQLIWQGLATGVVTERVRKDPAAAINRAVTEIFKRFPVSTRDVGRGD